MHRGGEVMFEWNGIDYTCCSIRQNGERYYSIAQCGTVEVNRATTKRSKAVDEMLEYKVNYDEDGWATAIRHETDHGYGNSHSNPHDHYPMAYDKIKTSERMSLSFDSRALKGRPRAQSEEKTIRWIVF